MCEAPSLRLVQFQVVNFYFIYAYRVKSGRFEKKLQENSARAVVHNAGVAGVVSNITSSCIIMRSQTKLFATTPSPHLHCFDRRSFSYKAVIKWTINLFD